MQRLFIRSNFPNESQFNDDDYVAIPEIEYFNELDILLSETNNKVFVNFIFLRIVHTYSGLLGDERNHKEMFGSARGSRCLTYVFYNLPISVNAYWVRRYFNRRTKAFVETIANGMKFVLRNNINHSSWLNDGEKEIALRKISQLKVHAAYPEEFDDDEKMIRIYENITIDEKKFFEAFLLMEKLERHEMFKDINHPRNKTDWIYHSYVAVINAFYYVIDNDIRKFIFVLLSSDDHKSIIKNKKIQSSEIPAAFLQGDIFNLTWANNSMDYMNYASLGFSISHEMGHALDPTGILFDDKGVFDKWMSNDTQIKTLEKFDCLTLQYDKLTDNETGLNCNGTLTLNENFADNGNI